MNTKEFFEETADEYDKKRNKNYLKQALINFDNIFNRYKVENKNILEIGVGTGEVFKLLCNKSDNTYGFDVSENMIKIAQNKSKKARLYVGDAENIANKDDSFEFIVCMDVLEHLENPEKCLNEIRRVLKKNGIAFVVNPNQLWGPIQYLAELFGLKVKEGKHNFVNVNKIIPDKIDKIYQGYLVFLPFGGLNYLGKIPLIRNFGFSQLIILKKI